MSKKSNTEEFIEKCQKKYGNIYDYSKVKYETAIKEVLIGCPKHGFFPTTPNRFLDKRIIYGCKKCGNKSSAKKRLDKQSDVIKKFKKVHGNRYDYSKVIYEKTDKDVIVICKEKNHAPFPIRPNNHLQGKGCPKCADESQINDLSGRSFGQLSIISVGSNKDKNEKGISKNDRSKYWWVKCSCGKGPYLVSNNSITSSGVSACFECSNIERRKIQEVEFLNDLLSRKYGMLSPLRDWGMNKHRQRLILCRCDCGSTPIVVANHLKNGHTKSCGCYALHAGEDSFVFFKNNQDYANKACFFYIAKLNEELNKPGITENLKKRKEDGKYEKYFFSSEESTRVKVWVIEQIILYESKNAMPKKLPLTFRGMSGQFEIRNALMFSPENYKDRFYELFKEVASKGWEDVYLSRFEI